MQREDRFTAERGRQFLMIVLFASCAIAALFALIQFIEGSHPPLVLVGRFAVALLAAYFVFKGSAVARALFAIYSGAAAAGAFGAAASLGLAKGDIASAVLLLIYACVNAYAVWAMFGVPEIQAYWEALKAERDGSADS